MLTYPMFNKIVAIFKLLKGLEMYKALLFMMIILVIPSLQSCTTSNATGKGSDILDSLNKPSGTSGCISPKIITEDGICKDPDKLSWEDS